MKSIFTQLILILTKRKRKKKFISTSLISTLFENIKKCISNFCLLFNRFGAGIIIYWFGYHESTPKLPENSIGIIVLDDFPAQSDVILLEINKKLETLETNIKEET